MPDGQPLAALGAVIVAHARVDLAARCLETLPKLARRRVVVVVNAPARIDPAELAHLRDRATVVSPPRPQGYGANLNLGVETLPRGLESLLLANDDVEFEPGSVELLAAALARDPGLGVVGPALRAPGRPPTVELPRAPTAQDALLDALRVLPLGPLSIPIARRLRTAPLRYLVGAALLVRAAAFGRIGGFDERFFLYFEETDFCFRMQEAGWRVAPCEEAVVVHVGAVSTAHRHWRTFLQSRQLYFRRRVGRTRLVLLQAAIMAILAAGAVYHALAAVVRPRSASRRLALLRDAWRWRLFLLGRRVRA